MMKLMPHQVDAAKLLGNGKILYGGVGSGKTTTSLAYYIENEKERDLYVITTAKKRDSLDWEREAAKWGIGTARDATVAGVLTVDSWNNIGRYCDCENAFFIFDEQRLVGSGVWVRSFLKIAKRNRWLMLSATPGDNWIDYAPVFIANGWFKNISDFKMQHVRYAPFVKFPKIAGYLGEEKLQRLRNNILIEMPYLKHTERILNWLDMDYNHALWDRAVKDRWHVYENRPITDVGELFRVMRRIANSDPSRLETVRKLLKSHPKLIVFYNFNFELEILRTLGQRTCRVLHVKDSGKTTDEHQVYVGRPSKWGNPFVLEHEEDREVILERYREYIVNSPLMNDLHELRGKNLVCYCAPKLCHADVLLELANPIFNVAEWNGHRKQPIPDSDSWVYLVQYVAGAEAWECIETDAMCMYSLTYSYKNFVQAQGRIDRLNTPFTDLYYYILASFAPIDLAIRKSLQQKKSFNEREFEKEFQKSGLES